ncbi:MAG: heme ABC exporter ATP-binding protein CcmA [Sedimentisphaerales bacterium]|nr:heme ABC exporter ATP-binding protein CcmA [Sedimentisphaerales bacterium]
MVAETHSPAVQVNSVSKAFGARPVLKGVSLAATRGEAVCLCGVNGAGKSTLLQIISGLLRPDRGSVDVGGHNTADHPGQFKRQLGMISHKSMVYPELTVTENLNFVARLYGVTNRAARIDELLARTGLTAFSYDRAAILSRGLLQRLAIARALLHEPSVLLADEPFAGLDGSAVEYVLSVFADFVASGGTLLTTTHDTRLGLRCCSRVAVLDAGAILLDRPKEQVDSERFIEDYLSYARSGS